MNLFEFTEEEVTPSFVVNGPGEASMVMRMIKKQLHLMDDAKATRDAEIASINEWYNNRLLSIGRQLDFLEGVLMTYITARRKDIPDFTVHTPHGSAYIKGENESIGWIDENKVMDFAIDHGYDDMIRTKQSLDKTAAKKRLLISGDAVVDKSSGEVVDGAEVQRTPAKLIVKLVQDKIEEEAA